MVEEINWDNFKAKFSNTKQTSFERLCYLLFCKEFDRDIGIFRFRNQAGIETNPIEKNGQIIGWQAKFYETTLSSNKDDFIESINTTKTRYPTVNKIIFYTNQDFGQHPKKTDPQYKLDIDAHAKSKNIEIEWRTASYFEAPFVSEQNFSIAQHFFSLKAGILDSIAELTTSTESILNPIRSEIIFGGKTIKIDRTCVALELGKMSDTTQLIILNGGAGVGKTAVIKDFYEATKSSSPLFVFKATQFRNVPHINQLFKNYGEITFSEFISEHNDIKQKYIVIDSAERLAEIEDQDVFKGFLADLLQNHWVIIFTVRYNYLDDLRYLLKESYGVASASLNIPVLTDAESEEISKENNFILPQNKRLYDLLRTPLYLSEYLQNHADIKEDISYGDFRDILWKKQIQNSTYQSNNIHIRREDCFLKIARRRADEGGFFVQTVDCDQEALQRLGADEIIKHDPAAGGYFITHDVYEEWALDKIIERSFISAQDYKKFYEAIGESLPIRRAFRSWLSDKLSINDEGAKKLIEFTIGNNEVSRHWRDEVLVAVLLSDYADIFFEKFEDSLLKDPERIVSSEGDSKVAHVVSVRYKDEDSLLYKVLFLLRIACKTVDEEFLRRLGIIKTAGVPIETIFTMPKGRGWHCTIEFVNKHRDKLKFRYMNVVLPVLDDWNAKYKDGETTKHAGQMALFYYNELTKERDFYFSSRDDTKDKLVRTILNASHELKNELTEIIGGIIAQKDVTHRGRYYPLVEVILSSVHGSFEISRNLPEEVLKLANLFWARAKEEDDFELGHTMGVESDFGLPEEYLNYFPASAFQTPIYNLLRFAPQQTASFILSLVNRSVQSYMKSELKDEAEEIEIHLSDTETIKQYISHRLWNTYRGTQVSTHLLESIHMALEKWLLENGPNTPTDILENWCFYLIRNSKSSSVTAAVASLVLAQPSKLFNVAKILFQTKEFFFYETSRLVLDQGAKFNFSIGYEIGDYENNFHRDERIATCEDSHRRFSLENLFLNYQIFVTQEEGEELAKQRQKILWDILDEYYKKLPDPSTETIQDKTWRLYLARMDRRKMKFSSEEKDGQMLISFNPEIDPELKKYSEESIAKNSASTKHVPLQLWARNRLEKNEEGCKAYPQYENDHELAISETKTIAQKLKKNKDEDGSFSLFYRAVPSLVCSVMIRDNFEKLKEEEKNFCRDVLLEYASMPLGKIYRYQTGDGVAEAINALPLLLKYFPESRAEIKKILLLTLFDAYPVGMSQKLSDYPTGAILGMLWKENFADANSIFLGFLALKPKYDVLRETMRKESHKDGTYNFSNHDLLNRFIEKNRTEIDKFIANQIVYDQIQRVADTDPDVLAAAFRILPLETTDETHKRFMQEIFPIFAAQFFTVGHRSGEEDEIHFEIKRRFLEKFAYMVLYFKTDEINGYLNPFIENFKNSKDAADFFSEFVSAEDRVNQYEQFWIIWKLFYPKVVELAKNKNARFYSSEILHNYLLAWGYWKKEAKEWHSLKEREKVFFKKISEDAGNNPAVLYSLSKLFNEIGSGFRDDGIIWISDMITHNPDLASEELEINTIYYLENLMRSYITKNRQNVRTTAVLKGKIITILDFLLAKGSVTAYLLREDIL